MRTAHTSRRPIRDTIRALGAATATLIGLHGHH
jgi:hypothetical protein